MFTGIIEATASVIKKESRKGVLKLSIEQPKGWRLKTGESICVDGTCLTVVHSAPDAFDVELMPETLRSTTFGNNLPARVNLERSLTAGARIDGHFVTGHVDAVGSITRIDQNSADLVYSITFPEKCNRFVAPKGSIAIDGISLTIVEAPSNSVTVALIPYTLQYTTLDSKKVGDAINIEFDILAKYVASQLSVAS